MIHTLPSVTYVSKANPSIFELCTMFSRYIPMGQEKTKVFTIYLNTNVSVYQEK